MSYIQKPPLFISNVMAGIECADHYNLLPNTGDELRFGPRHNMVKDIGHDVYAAHDFKLLAKYGLHTVRMGTGWPRIETTPGRYDTSAFEYNLDAALQNGIDPILTMCHYGMPDDLTAFSPEFPQRLAAYSKHMVNTFRNHSDAVLKVIPVNELSFFAYGVSDGAISPCERGRGWEAKQNLVRGSIAAMDAMWSVDPTVRFMHVDPISNIVTPADRPELAVEAAAQDQVKYQAWDMLCGRLCPELGGKPEYLDIVGVNYYYNNQWEHQGNPIRWRDEVRDPRWKGLSSLFMETYDRYKDIETKYGAPVFIVGETGDYNDIHTFDGRAPWMKETIEEIKILKDNHIPIEGVCIFPIFGRKPWDYNDIYVQDGLFDFNRNAGDLCDRWVYQEDYGAEIKNLQLLLNDPKLCLQKFIRPELII